MNMEAFDIDPSVSFFLILMLCLLTFEISKDQEGNNFYTRGPCYTCLVFS